MYDAFETFRFPIEYQKQSRVKINVLLCFAMSSVAMKLGCYQIVLWNTNTDNIYQYNSKELLSSDAPIITLTI